MKLLKPIICCQSSSCETKYLSTC